MYVLRVYEWYIIFFVLGLVSERRTEESMKLYEQLKEKGNVLDFSSGIL